ncbi:MAG TPA: 30S ribosomal protein S18 [Candidatus Wirthbacteria bacterium]|nr:30S ribosomal protein S18 [Candidatus Wirthbacteria bacterium]
MIRPTFSYKKRACRYCEDKEAEIDYKDTASLKKFTSDLGKIIGRKKTGLCAKHQRQVVREIKRARYMALMPYTAQVKF